MSTSSPNDPVLEGARADGWSARERDVVLKIPVSLKVVLGTTRMPVGKVLSLARGTTIPLDRKIGEPVDIMVNDRLFARGEVVVLDGPGSRFAVSITEIVGDAVD